MDPDWAPLFMRWPEEGGIFFFFAGEAFVI